MPGLIFFLYYVLLTFFLTITFPRRLERLWKDEEANLF